MPFATVEQSREDGIARTVLTLVDYCRYASEVKIQNLLYLAELDTIENSTSQDDWQRFLDVEFKAYVHGAFSEVIDLQLEILREEGTLDYKKKIIDEQKYTIHFIPDSTTDVPSVDADLLDRMCGTFGRYSTPEIVDLVKDTWLFKQTELDQQMQFDAYVDQVHGG